MVPNRIIGTLTLAYYHALSGNKAWIEDVVVEAQARGTGAGEALVRHAVEEAKKQGATTILLTSNAARKAAHNLYKKIGFIEYDTTVFRLQISKP